MTRRDRKRRGFRAPAEDEMARLTFHGAAGEVTGSCFLLETRDTRILVECGMFQGGRRETTRNRRPFPFDAAGLDALVLTHGHIDHSGLAPKLVRDGHRGPIHVTRATGDLLGIMLPDSAHIHEQDARRESKRRLRRGRDAVEPLYTVEDAERALQRIEPHPFDERFAVASDVDIRFRRAGHILGASSVELWVRAGHAERKLVFSGDVGRTIAPLLRDPDPPDEADLVVMESTYGDRDHRDMQASLEELAAVFVDAAEEGRNVIVPVFAVGRAQDVLFHLAEFERDGRIPPRPVFLDSPMAIDVTELYSKHPDCFEAPAAELFGEGRHRIEPAGLRYCRTPEESMALNDKKGIVILAASGMCDAGRVVHHLKHNLWRGGTHVVIAGFQAAGTTGRALVDGARRVRILGEEIAVRARIHTIGGFSAHAGRSELVSWVRGMAASGARLALVHGEPEKRAALDELLLPVVRQPVFLPETGDTIAIRRSGELFALQPA